MISEAFNYHEITIPKLLILLVLVVLSGLIIKFKYRHFTRFILGKGWTYLIVTIAFAFLTAFVFTWEDNTFHIFDSGYPADAEKLGNLGDFCGGILGPIFGLVSIWLVLKTLSEQKIVAGKQIGQTDIQRFNDLFFELLHLHQKQVEYMEISIPSDVSYNSTSEGLDYLNAKKYKGKDFFVISRESLYNKFSAYKRYRANHAAAVNAYLAFYWDYRHMLDTYFRTLYRIYDHIYKSKIPENEKRDYLKIIRAQLSDAELFFLRYNAYTLYGKNFVGYINRYNILKHLSISSLLEFSDWRHIFPKAYDRRGINFITHRLTKELKTLLAKDGKCHSELENMPTQRFKMIINKMDNYTITITLVSDYKFNNKIREYGIFNQIDSEGRCNLIKDICREIFIYRSFKKFNDPSSIRIDSRTRDLSSSPSKPKTIHVITIKGQNGHELKLKEEFKMP